MRLTAGQTSDFKGAAMMVDALPPAKTMLADRAYDAPWFRQAPTERDITPCISPHASRKIQHIYDRTLINSATASKICSHD
jgi:transposase